MKKTEQITNSIILCLFEVLVGVLLLINPVAFTSGIIITTGVVLLVIGLINIIRYFRTDALEAALSQSLARGLMALLVGFFCTFNSHWFIATFPVLTIVYGIAILITGLSKVQLTVDMLRAKKNKWFLAAISAVISLLCSVIILNNPFASTAALWTFTGISLIAEAIFDVINLLVNRKDKEAAE